MTIDFEELMIEIQNGNSMAFEVLFESANPKVAAFLFQIGVHADDVDDLTQETMYRVWERCQQYKPKQGRIMPWIFSIARNQWIDLCRRRGRQTRGGGRAFVDVPLDDVEDEPETRNPMVYTALRKEIDALPDDMREICDATLSGETLGEVGQRLGYSRNKVGRRFKEAREIMEGSVVLRRMAEV